MRPHRRSQLLGDLVVVGPGVLERERGRAGELGGALADLVFHRALGNAQTKRGSNQEGRRKDGGEEEDQLEPQGHPAVF